MSTWSEEDLHHGWHSACALRQGLLSGYPVPQLPPPPVRLFPGEVAFAHANLRHEVWYGMDVEYQTSTMAFGGPLMFTTGLLVSAAGNARRKRQAQAMAAAQWRYHGHNSTLLTNHRVLTFSGNRWVTWALDQVMEVWPSPREFTYVLVFNDADPLRLTGPAAPWFMVVTAHLTFGPRFLAEHPEFRTMGVQQAQTMPAEQRGLERGTG
ncbi:hypothetical protein ACIBH1_31250 [Nonomuraea sp. NPDC050663]|uniref:hypothetical protein n=1 Tax=Nonomuraea sp. NPDC050663 TaxID=3364370 RepID=UPI00379433D1